MGLYGNPRRRPPTSYIGVVRPYKCRLCEERRKNPFPPSSDEEEEDIFLDPKDLPVSSPLRKIQRGRGGDRRSKQFKKDRRERIRAIRRGEGGRKQ